ncbi:MAG TPA: lantibiotic dehydratase, partial [Ktedonobacteraceae bacterium]|nr:lantibiotic dehydratase [Ktedonobacteraceae bacterium]
MQQLALFSVVRVGGVAAQSLEPLLFTRTTTHIADAFQAECEMQMLVAPLEEVLYRLVPAVGDQKELRRRILAVKRNVHNLRLWDGAANDGDLVAPAMGEDGMLLHEWLRLAQMRQAALQRAALTYDEELAAARAAIAAGVSDRHFQQGLALASPELLKELERPLAQENWRPTSKLARSSLLYLTRAALKTSPLSTFTRMAVSDFVVPVQDASAGQRSSATGEKTSRNGDLHREVRIVRMLPSALLALIARHPDLAPVLSFEPNKGMTQAMRKPEKLRVLTNQYYITGDFSWRGEQIVDHSIRRKAAPDFLSFLESGRRVSYHELLALLPKGRGKNTHVQMIQLLDKQLFRPVAPYSRQDGQPLLALARVLERGMHPLATALAAHTRTLQACVDASKEAGGFERLRLLDNIRQQATAMFELLGVPAPEWLNNNLLYEDVEYGKSRITLPAQVQEDLAHAAIVLRPGIKRTKLYDYLYQDFVERFGSNGETSDILGFFADFIQREDFTELVARVGSDDRTSLLDGTGDRSQLPGGESAAPPVVTVLYQLAADSPEALARGDYKLVINQVLSSEGGLLGRFQQLLGPEHGDLPAKLRQWSKESLYGGREVVEMPTIGDWHNLQGELGITERTLRWPAETPTSEDDGRTLELCDLRLRANAQDETLYFVDRHGQAVAPTYLGVVPRYLFTHALRLMLTVMYPWVSDHAVGWQTTSFNLNTQSPDQVEFFPRQEHGRVVFRRARWRFPPGMVPTRQKGESDIEFFIKMQRWQQEHQLPDELFVSTDRPQVSFEAKARKPIWINFRSPHSLELLRQYLDGDVIAVCFTEALPARQQYWVEPEGDSHGADESASYVSEFMTQLHWPMPQAEKPKDILVPVRGSLLHAQDNWLYFKIYPSRSDQLDEVIRCIVSPSVALARDMWNLERWFFIRYMDQRGWHIRLRLRGPLEGHQQVRQEIEHMIDRMLPLLTHEKQYRILPAYLSPPLQDAKPGYSLAQYQPEYEKYGGRTGVLIAERLFDASSELAIQAVMQEP